MNFCSYIVAIFHRVVNSIKLWESSYVDKFSKTALIGEVLYN